jgi:hypothetical protein
MVSAHGISWLLSYLIRYLCDAMLKLSYASSLMNTLYSLRGLTAHPQNPHSWSTSLPLLLEAAEMRFLRSVKGYTRLDKIRSEVIRKELEIAGIQAVRSKHKQNWINHLERMDNTRIPKHALNYQPRRRRDPGRRRKNGNASMQ